ncbi:VapB protein of antitoxin of type II toxin-antitoxin system [Blastococcus colisei]|uniref:VapB protein of antitoxin of type II toxin-antitoxin system n=1 Tax=Blastococcus colisei TaxID=1564162 RepID=A0A543PFU4_9ACTN|nr:type II toxin-antitoxin system VapB family antitoxin [Blastococcus colisei]TQN42937.1 VapB protein of antitoxin of type II toxin-antitoxin system [Blastococcus colisei]
MAKTLVDIPADKLARAQARLGTATKRETVERALDLVLEQAEQRELIMAVAAGQVSSHFTPEVLGKVRPGA